MRITTQTITNSGRWAKRSSESKAKVPVQQLFLLILIPPFIILIFYLIERFHYSPDATEVRLMSIIHDQNSKDISVLSIFSWELCLVISRCSLSFSTYMVVFDANREVA